MKGKPIGILIALLSFLGVLIALPTVASAEVVTMHLTQPPGGNTLYNIYLSPYAATIDGATQSVPVICDDFTDDTYIDEKWSATVYDGGADLSGTRMAQKNPLWSSEELNQAYDAAAYLAVQLLQSGVNGPDQGYLSFAIWDIFADGAVHDFFGNTQYYSDVNGIARSALTNATPGERSILTIYSPNVGQAPTCGTGACPTAPPQEFLVVRTPEASIPAYLGINLLGLLAVLLLVRRRFPWNSGAPN